MVVLYLSPIHPLELVESGKGLITRLNPQFTGEILLFARIAFAGCESDVFLLENYQP